MAHNHRTESLRLQHSKNDRQSPIDLKGYSRAGYSVAQDKKAGGFTNKCFSTRTLYEKVKMQL